MSDKCAKCKKFSSVLVSCKCDNKFCTIHLLPEKHSCAKIYDFGRISYEKNEELLNKYATKSTSNLVRLE